MRTVTEVPALAPPIHSTGPARRLAGSLGKLTSLDTEVSDTRRTVKEPLTTVRAGLPAAALQFPAGAETRRLDANGRIKVAWSNSSTQGVGLSSLLGWKPGALDAVIVDGWMVLTQRPELIGAKTRRQSIHGRFNVGANGVERIGLTAAHIDRLGANEFRTVLIAPVPHAPTPALLVMNPVVCLAGAPSHVVAVIHPENGGDMPPHLTVIEGDQP